MIMKNKRGISAVVVTLMMIVLVLAAIAIIWAIIGNILESGTEKINLGTKCLEVDIRATNLACSGTNNDICSVTVTRNPGGEDIEGIKLIFTNSTGTGNYVHDVSGNIASLGVKTETNVSTGISNANNVEVVVYFKDSVGSEQLCSAIL